MDFPTTYILGDEDLDARPYAASIAQSAPELWARFVATCERERRELEHPNPYAIERETAEICLELVSVLPLPIYG